jgi:hypothetical protein
MPRETYNLPENKTSLRKQHLNNAFKRFQPRPETHPRSAEYVRGATANSYRKSVLAEVFELARLSAARILMLGEALCKFLMLFSKEATNNFLQSSRALGMLKQKKVAPAKCVAEDFGNQSFWK